MTMLQSPALQYEFEICLSTHTHVPDKCEENLIINQAMPQKPLENILNCFVNLYGIK